MAAGLRRVWNAERGAWVTDTHPPYTVALDAMGGDDAPAEQVKGAIAAARDTGTNVLLVGDPDALEAELGKHDTVGLPLKVIPSEGVIEEGEHPSAGAAPEAQSPYCRGHGAGEGGLGGRRCVHGLHRRGHGRRSARLGPLPQARAPYPGRAGSLVWRLASRSSTWARRSTAGPPSS